MVELQRKRKSQLGGTAVSDVQTDGHTVASRTSCTPYSPVDSIKSRANAIPGRILAKKMNYLISLCPL